MAEHIKLSVELSSGDFSASVSVPVTGSERDFNSAVERWLELMQAALKTGVGHMTALIEKEPSHETK